MKHQWEYRALGFASLYRYSVYRVVLEYHSYIHWSTSVTGLHRY